jgi:hypothetical protein
MKSFFSSILFLGLLVAPGLGSIPSSDDRSPLLVALGLVSEKAPEPTVQTEIKLIGAGFPRTGTTSTKLALELLGYKVGCFYPVI